MKRYSSNKRRDSSKSPQQNAALLTPSIVGYMSVDVSREYHSDLSQLKFINYIPERQLSWDLNHNIRQAVKRTTDDNDEKIDLLLKFLLDQGNRLHFPQGTFISYRRTLINIMYSAFNIIEPVTIRACLYNNNIYLNTIDSLQDIQRRQNRSEQEKIYCAWGYKFEQYLLSDQPTLTPDINKPVIENEEFSLYFSSQIGHHKLFYGAQIDGLLATSNSVPIPPKTTDVHEIIDYLRCNNYVELKTNRELDTPKQVRKFKFYKLLRCWCQCYLANLKGLLVGFRDDLGIVQRLQWFDTGEIVEYCKNEWDPQTALNFLDHFLTIVKDNFKTLDGTYSASTANHRVTNSLNCPLTLEFHILPNRKIKVDQVHQMDKMFLPAWYTEVLQKQ